MESEYGSPCIHKGQIKNMFCKVCNKFICAYCTDPHKNTNEILWPNEIDEYALALYKCNTLKNNSDSIAHAKKMLQDSCELISSILDDSNTKDEIIKAEQTIVEFSKQKLVDTTLSHLQSTKGSPLVSQEIDGFHNKFDSLHQKILEQLHSFSSSLDPVFVINTIETLADEPLLHRWTNQNLDIIDFKNGKSKSYMLTSSIHPLSDSISVNKIVYVIGHWNPSSNEASEIVLNSNGTANLKPLAPMNIAKGAHSLVSIKRVIYSIGGYTNLAITDCESYSIADNVWKQLPQLNVGRDYEPVFSWKEKFIYAMGGEGLIPGIERWQIESTHWEIINVGANEGLTRKQMMHGFVAKDDIALLFGNNSSDMLAMSLSETGVHSLSVAGSLCQSARFCETASPIKRGHSYYAIDHERNVHVYDVTKGGWSIMNIQH